MYAILLPCGAAMGQLDRDYTVQVAVTLSRQQPRCELRVSNPTINFGTREIPWPGSSPNITVSPRSGAQATLTYSRVSSYSISSPADGRIRRSLTGPGGKTVGFTADLQCRFNQCSRNTSQSVRDGATGSVDIQIGGTVYGSSYGLPGTPAGTYTGEFNLNVSCGS